MASRSFTVCVVVVDLRRTRIGQLAGCRVDGLIRTRASGSLDLLADSREEPIEHSHAEAESVDGDPFVDTVEHFLEVVILGQ